MPPVAAEDISAVCASNRLVAEPYTKLMTSFPTVDLAAAVVVVSEELADRLAVPQEQRVYPWVVAAAREPYPPSARPAMDHSKALDAAVRRALDVAAIGPDAVDTFDLYSCFPAAVQLAAAAFGVEAVDSRGLTVAGGLPYFGGPGASYTLHSVICTVERCRDAPGSVGAVVGLGGMVNDFSVALYSTASRPSFVYDQCPDLTPRLEAHAVPISVDGSGLATVEAMTVLHDRDAGPVAAPVIARLPDGSRIGARAASADLVGQLAGATLVGEQVRITAGDAGARYEPA